MSDPTSRVLRLLSLLQTHRFWPGRELADRLEVSDRTLRRDVERLRELGYVVDSTPGVEGGYRLAAGSHMPPLLLDDEEAVAIAVGLRAAAAASVQGMEETSLRALAKLEQVLPDRLRRRVGAVHSNVVPLRWQGDGPMVTSEQLAILALACRDGEEVRFDYARGDGEESRRLVQPHQLVSAGRRWYLLAWDVRREDWRTFRVDRITDARGAGSRFEHRPIPGGDAAAFVADSIGSMPGRFSARVRVRAAPDQIAEWTRNLGGEPESLGDGWSTVGLSADSAEWIAVTVCGLAMDHDVEVDPDDSSPEVTTRVDGVRARLSAAADRPGGHLGAQPT